MTTEDKIWMGTGAVLALGAGVYYFTQKDKQNKDLESIETVSSDPLPSIDLPRPIIPKMATPPIVAPRGTIHHPPTREAETFRYAVGQEVMAIGFNGTKAYDARKMADGNYVSEGIRKATFKKGDPIGKIVWVGAKPDGTYRYVVQRNGTFLNNLYWIADASLIKPIGKILPVITTQPSSEPKGIDKNKLLKIGSKGAEVKALQKLLGIKADGDFGHNTQKALLMQKKVKQIRLNSWK